MGEEVGGDGGAGLPAPSHGEMAMQGCPLPTDSEEESGAAGPARPLPSMQTFAFQTQMRRCRASGGQVAGAGPPPPRWLFMLLPQPRAFAPLITCVHIASASATLSRTSLLGALL